jgi:hypothetical protein
MRLLLAFRAFFRILFDGGFARRVREAIATPEPGPASGLAAPAAIAPGTPSAPAIAEAAGPGGTPDLRVLALFQREGRLLDFLKEDIDDYEDAQVGAAVRAIHKGCRKVLAEHLDLEPIRTEREGASIEVPPGFDPGSIRLIGNVRGSPPFRGALKHHGWRVSGARLPQAPAGQDPRVLAPAEVDVP